MNKTELVDAIAKRTGETKLLSGKMLDAVLGAIVDSVAGGEVVRLVGFGTFDRTNRNARVGRNPQTGESVDIAATTVPKFTAGQPFRDKVAADAPIATDIAH